MHSNFQFHVISGIDIVHLLSVYSVGRQ